NVTNVSSDAKRPIALIAVTAPRGTKARITATAIGNQMVQLRMLVIAPHPAPLRGGKALEIPLPLAGEGATKRRVRVSREYPYKNNHSDEEHQRVIAHKMGRASCRESVKVAVGEG